MHKITINIHKMVLLQVVPYSYPDSFSEIPAVPYPLVFYLVYFIFSSFYAVVKQTPVLVFHTKKVPVRK